MEPTEAVAELARMPEHTGTNTCFGMPISAGDRTVMLVAEVMYGFGFGWGSGSANEAYVGDFSICTARAVALPRRIAAST